MDSRRMLRGLGWGALATVAMSLLMIIATRAGVSPMPAPIPVALIKALLGPLPRPALLTAAAISHLGYGAVWGAALAVAVPHPTLRSGLLLGAFLWLLMQVLVLPFLGWGVFGMALTPKIAVATLILHLVYGATLGAGLARGTASAHPIDPDASGAR